MKLTILEIAWSCLGSDDVRYTGLLSLRTQLARTLVKPIHFEMYHT